MDRDRSRMFPEPPLRQFLDPWFSMGLTVDSGPPWPYCSSNLFFTRCGLFNIPDLPIRQVICVCTRVRDFTCAFCCCPWRCSPSPCDVALALRFVERTCLTFPNLCSGIPP
jgi:hypothetical protein